MGLAFAILILSIALRSFNPVLMKMGALQTNEVETHSFFQALLSPYFIIPLIIMAYHAIAWSFLLRKISLSILYPLSYGHLALLPFTSAIVLSTPIKIQHMLGAGLMVFGAFLMREKKADDSASYE